MAEWLCSGLQSRLRRFDSGFSLQTKFYMNNLITVAGMVYVGLSNSLLLARKNKVVGYDIEKKKINDLKKKISPIIDKQITKYLQKDNSNLTFTTSKSAAYKSSNIIFVATPTNYDPDTKEFDTSCVESVIKDILKYNEINPIIVIRSTIPIGFIDECRRKFNYSKIIFCPEFLREGKALYDSLYPSRIVVGAKDNNGKLVGELLKNSAIKKNIKIIYTGSNESESIKLFANTYLAMRVSYFNELDTYAAYKNLNSKEIIEGISYDPRIGMHYNNPSFGYGGYCLPKDTKQLLANFKRVPNSLIKAIVKSNDSRKKAVVKLLVKQKVKTIGIYRLTMKAGSDNFRSAAILDIIDQLKTLKKKIVIFEPSISEKQFMNCTVNNNINSFKSQVEIILANRITKDIADFENIFTRDIYESDE